MKLVGFRFEGLVTIGVVRGEKVIPLAPVITLFEHLPHWLEVAKTTTEQGVPLASVIQAPAVTPAARVLCVGLNYRAHAAEGGREVPDYPAIFGRWTKSLITAGDTIPAIDPKLDWECELAAVIGERMASVDEAEGLRGVMGYAVFNDVSARTYQRHTPQWTPGKNMDRSGVIGPIVTADEVGDPRKGLRLVSRLNGEIMQDGNTADMIFSVGKIISYLSEIMTLEPGDVIATGTPEGVGFARKPPVFMKAGDEIEVEVEKLGSVRNLVVEGSKR